MIAYFDHMSSGNLTERLSVMSVDEFRYISNELEVAVDSISEILKEAKIHQVNRRVPLNIQRRNLKHL